jgi:FkbM family methyltransferase
MRPARFVSMLGADTGGETFGVLDDLDRWLSHGLSAGLAWISGWPLVGVRLHRLFARALPIRRFTVRGVSIACALPLHQVGTRLEAFAWATREPEVLDWIDGFGPNAVLFDVGANFGTETLYAALKPGGPARVCAFDAELIGSYNLALNLTLNGITTVDNHVVAVGDRSGFVTVPENLNYLHVDGLGKYARSTKRVRMIALDDFVAETGLRPTHVKIDVDGPERAIVAGLRQTLRDPALRSLMIEINDAADHTVITAMLDEAGFVERPRSHANAYNHIYDRQP